MTYADTLQAIIDSLTASKADAESFDSGNDSAGRRLRKTCQDAKTSLQDLRLAVQAERTSRKAPKA